MSASLGVTCTCACPLPHIKHQTCPSLSMKDTTPKGTYRFHAGHPYGSRFPLQITSNYHAIPRGTQSRKSITVVIETRPCPLLALLCVACPPLPLWHESEPILHFPSQSFSSPQATPRSTARASTCPLSCTHCTASRQSQAALQSCVQAGVNRVTHEASVGSLAQQRH